MIVHVVCFVVAQAFEDMCEVVGDEIKAHEQEEHGHGEAG